MKKLLGLAIAAVAAGLVYSKAKESKAVKATWHQATDKVS